MYMYSHTGQSSVSQEHQCDIVKANNEIKFQTYGRMEKYNTVLPGQILLKHFIGIDNPRSLKYS